MEAVSPEGCLVVDRELGDRAPRIALLVRAKIEDGVAERRRVAHQLAHEAETFGSPARAHEQTKMRASARRHAGPKDVELLSIAFDASFTHMYAPRTRRHIQNALKAGASIEEIFEVLKLCVAQGMQAFVLGAPILAEELAKRADSDHDPS
jgi:alkylhydroperoxidase/carboxymuconolactone decarboxylase family protein YurZ